MSDARQSPIPPERADEDKQQPRPSPTAPDASAPGVAVPGTKPEKQPGIPDDPAGPAEGGD